MKNPKDETDKCQLQFACIACNRTTQALRWANCGLVAYGACYNVALYKPNIKNSTGKLLHVLNGHSSRVNCVEWIRSDDEDDLELASGSSDNTVILWQGRNGKWEKQQVLSGHLNMVCALTSVVSSASSYLVSASSDFSIKLWTKCNNDSMYDCSQTISFGNAFVYTISMACLPDTDTHLLACGCDDTTIQLYVLNGNHLDLVLVLKGHKDAIRCLAFTKSTCGDLLLASGSQDSYIRLWKISTRTVIGLGSSVECAFPDVSVLALQEQVFTSCAQQFSVVLESVLIGHEGWVLGVSWGPLSTSMPTPWPSLLSASMDRTAVLWKYHDEEKVWIDTARMGEVGGNTLGYYGCASSPLGLPTSVIVHGYQGALQMWTQNTDDDKKWRTAITISGHFGQVEDFDWDKDGDFVITASTDQSTRLFALWNRDSMASTWHEIARPQIHGYDMKAIVMLDRYKYASGAQEKVVRVFSAPRSFYNSFSCISNIEASNQEVTELPLGATVPVLGLSNKAVYQDDIASWSEEKLASDDSVTHAKKSPFVDEPALFNPALINEPPVEDVLLQNTLWPEIQKLYGHGFEIFSLAATRDGTVLATACKASKAEHANILIWDTTSWKLLYQLAAHSLTVTQMSFSNSGEYLLSVSRDRTWALHQRDATDNKQYTLLQKTDKTNCVHSRIIWSCAWTCDDRYFITVSRDKKAVVWTSNGSHWLPCGTVLNLANAATAISVLDQITSRGEYVIAVGLECGGVVVYTWGSSEDWTLVMNVDRKLCPVLHIKRLRWRTSKKSLDGYELGICSSDHTFRILRLDAKLLGK